MFLYNENHYHSKGKKYAATFYIIYIRLVYIYNISFYKYKLIYNTINNVPAVIKIEPIIDLIVNCSCKNVNAKIKVITTLNLSIGTTFDASPICNAL